MRGLWRMCCGWLTLYVGLFPVVASAANGTQEAPKLLNLFLDYYIADDDPAKLAKWDIIVLDMDQQFQFPEKVRQIKKINPKTKILAYVSVGEISRARFVGDQASPGYRMASRIPEEWFMHKPDGSRAAWWPGTYQMNATNLGASVQGQRWNTFVGPFIRDELMTSGLWDGVFLDSAYGEVSERFGDLDVDQDGRADDPNVIDRAWRSGMTELIRNVRRSIGPDKLILNNSSAAYAADTNGALFENFISHGWAWPFTEFRKALSQNASPKISAVNTNTNNEERPHDYRLMRFGLASALIADGYFSFDAGDQKHHRTWWYDEYEAILGKARSAARLVRGGAGSVPAVWSREYERGMVLVNATKKAEAVVLPGEFEKLRGTQDVVTNDGSIINRVNLPAEDGVILYRRSSSRTIQNASYVNGSFYAIYNDKGERERNGFFASRDDVAGGARVWVGDVDQDGREDILSSNAGELVIRLGGGSTTRVRPYGTAYKGGMMISAGQTDRTGAWEIIVSPTDGSVTSVLVLDVKGRVLKKILAYRPEFKGGAWTAVGDMDRDGRADIITSPGRGGGPHVRFFRADGTAWRGGFFAFTQAESGGANVATGDVDGDGIADLVVGSGAGAVPRVQIYNGKDFTLLREFQISNRPLIEGVRLLTADMDGDGKMEILVPSSPF